MVKIRFNLGRGENYMKWRIELKGLDGEKKVHYLPKETDLTLVKPKLCNRKATAKKIFEGADKSVCSWIECEDILVGVKFSKREVSEQIWYNPKRVPNWVDGEGNDLDGNTYDKIVIKNMVILILTQPHGQT